MKKLSIIVAVFISSVAFSQDEIKPCGQLPQVNPTVKAICENDINGILSEGLPASFKLKESYKSTFKLLIDCNGRIDMVIYKNGTLNSAQQKHFLVLLNKLKDWKSGQLNEVDVTTSVYFTIDIENRELEIKQY